MSQWSKISADGWLDHHESKSEQRLLPRRFFGIEDTTEAKWRSVLCTGAAGPSQRAVRFS